MKPATTYEDVCADMMDIRVEMRRKATGRLIKSPN